MIQIKGGQTHSDTSRMNKLNPWTRIYSKVLKMCFHFWNVCSFLFNQFCISSFWIAQQVQENKHCFLRLSPLVCFHGQSHWFCQQCHSQSSTHFFSHLALSFPLSLMPYILSPDSHHLETHGFRNCTCSHFLAEFWDFCTTLNPNPKQLFNVDSNEQTELKGFKRTDTVLTR